MRLVLSYITVFFLTYSSVAQTYNDRTVNKEIDGYITAVMDRYKIPGAAVAVLQNGEVRYQNYYGLSDLENKTPVTKNTLFKLHSLSKVFVSTAVFQLIEEDKLALDDVLSMYLNDLPEAWQQIQIMHLLTHSSGLPDMVRFEADSEEKHREQVFAAEIEFQPGDRFRYNQTNFWLLNRIIKTVTEASFEDYILKGQFNGSKQLLAFAQDKTAGHRALEYFPNEEGVLEVKDFDVPEYMYGAAGIALTLDTFIAWNKRLDADGFMKPETKAKMWTPFTYKNEHPFAYSWEVGSINNTPYVGFSGGTIVSLRKFKTKDLTVIFLTTGYRYFSGVNRASMYIAGLVDAELINRSISIRTDMEEQLLNTSVEAALVSYRANKKRYPEAAFEEILNSLGYEMMRRNQLAKAIKVFTLNTEEHPLSWNVWDSLAEGYETRGDTSNAIRNYKKSVTLNPENQHGIEQLKKLEQKN